jgi:hypothetical protein
VTSVRVRLVPALRTGELANGADTDDRLLHWLGSVGELGLVAIGTILGD